MQFPSAEAIAYVAHGATGATRADGVTPYIAHPRRVAELALAFAKHVNEPLNHAVLRNAALLHDVLEDTKFTREDLVNLGVVGKTIEVVELLTKKDVDAPATAGYYLAISQDIHALVVKCADRCANLEDSLKEVKAKRKLDRWKNYVAKTYKEVLPMYLTLPGLRGEIQNRLGDIELALFEVEREMYSGDDAPTFRVHNRVVLKNKGHHLNGVFGTVKKVAPAKVESLSRVWEFLIGFDNGETKWIRTQSLELVPN